MRLASVEIQRNADGTIQHHPIFGLFPPFSGTVSTDFAVDYIGARTRPEFLPYTVNRQSAEVYAQLPGFDEEYFEWIDVLESVKNAHDHYTMVELGAGYGRWAVRAALAARYCDLPFSIGLAEAEPKHVEWIAQHLQDNFISAEQARVHAVAVSDSDGTALFYVGMPEDFNESTARKWYGQSLAHGYERPELHGVADYEGHKVIEMQSKWKTVEVQKQDIRTILAQYNTIDLLDLDVQGEESRIIQAGIEQLTKQVKRLHIGTHGRDIEGELRKTLKQHRWQLVHDYPCFSTTRTQYGKISFNDGVQSWVNPHLASQPRR